MLMVSVGLVKAAVEITVPKGETLKITISGVTTPGPVVSINGTAQYTFSADGYWTVAKDDENPQTVSIANTFGGLKLEGKATALTVNNNGLETLEVSNLGLTSLELTSATGLNKVDISNNKELAAITGSGSFSSAEEINASNCGFTTWPNAFNATTTLKKLDLSNNALSSELNFTSFSALEELNVANNELQNDELTVPSTLKKLDVSGNSLRYVTGVTKDMDVTFGTQTYTAPSAFTADANKGLDFKDLNIRFDEPTEGDVTWEQVEATWTPAHGQKRSGDAAASTYYFYDSKGVYQQGTYDVTLTYGEAKIEIKDIKITPAKFNLDIVDPTNIKVTNQSGTEIKDNSQVIQGDIILVALSDEAKKNGLDLDSFVATALTEQTDKSDKDHKAFRVEGYWDASQDKEINPSIEAKLKDAMVDVTFKKNVDGTNNSIVAVAQKGNQTISLTPGETKKVPYGSKITVTFKAEPGYKTSILIDGTDKSADIKPVEGSTNEYVYVIEELAKTDLAITTNITKTNTVAITLKLEGEARNISDHVFAPNSIITIDGKEFKATNGKTNNIGVKGFTVGKEVQLHFALTRNAVFGGDVWKDNPITIESITYGSQKVDWQMKEVSNSLGTGNEANQPAREYTATFKVQEVDQTLVIRTKKNVVVDIIPTPDNASAGSKEQKHAYDGKEHPFAYKTNPAEYAKEVKVEYTSADGVKLNTGAPTEAGTYQVKYWMDATESHQRVLSNSEWKVVIEKAQPTVATKPKVEVNADGEYVITGGVAKGINGETLYGKWEVLDSNGNPVQKASKTDAHTVEVRFTVLVESSKAVDSNYKTATVSTSTGTVDECAVKYENIPDGITVTIYNGDLKLGQNDKVPEGAKVKVEVYVPDNYDITKVELKQNGNHVNWTTQPDGNSRTIIYENIKITEGTVFSVNGTSAFDINKEFVITPNEDMTVMYTGTEPEFSDFIVLKADNNKVDIDKLTGVQYAYTQVSGSTEYAVTIPKNAGTYKVYVTIPYQGNKSSYKEYKALENAYVGTLEITKVKTKITVLPRPTLIPKGQDLSQSNLIGGTAKALNEKGKEIDMTVAGTFDWYEYTGIPKDGEPYKVVFWPEESDNYDYAIADVYVTVSDKNLITIKDPGAQVGSIIVTNAKTGERFYGEEEIIEGTILRFQVTPASNFRFEQLLVNGSSWNPNEVYTVGNESVAISAVFSLIEPEVPDPEPSDPIIDEDSQYIVTVKKASTNNRGFILNKEGENGVYYEKAFEFTVNALDADLDKLVVTGATRVSKGKYRIESVTDNATVTVSLPNPTPIDVKVVTESKNAKGYLMGKVKAESYPLDGKCYYGDELVVVAYPESGVSFSYWKDNALNKDQMREIVVTKAMTIEAVFSGVPTGIEDIESASIYAGDGYIQVKNVANADLTIVSISGRIQARQSIEGDTQIRVPAGVYVVVLESGEDVKRVKVIVR
ncbi:hypothetical protein B5F77_07400 [Parabacteroides sp. An277]|nr:hypothetical protein B5F77_07400 [Parabacteroides sp. An277]